MLPIAKSQIDQNYKKDASLFRCSVDPLTFSGWMAFTVKRGRLVSAAPERPLGLECTKPLFITWLAMGAYAVAISTSACLSRTGLFLPAKW